MVTPLKFNWIFQGRKLDFAEAMKLEIERLRLNLSAAERDRALLSIGTDPATINPNLLLDELYIGRLCRAANTLALLGQASLEDKINGAIGLDNSDDSIINFWNVSRIGESCCGGMCEVRAETNMHAVASSTPSSSGASKSVLFCSQCERKACKVCCAGRGALLFANRTSREVNSYNSLVSQGGSGHGSQIDISTNRSTTLDGVICKNCCHEVVLDALMLDYVRVLISLRRRARAENAAYKALNEIAGSSIKDCLAERKQLSDSARTAKFLLQLVGGQESLAEFPFASFLHSVWFWFTSGLWPSMKIKLFSACCVFLLFYLYG